VYDTTLFRPRGGRAAAARGNLALARNEPEIVLHVKAPPPVTRGAEPGWAPADVVSAMLDCIDWIALGFEIVHSPFGLEVQADNGAEQPARWSSATRCSRVVPDCAKRRGSRRLQVTRWPPKGQANVDSPLLASRISSTCSPVCAVPPLAAGEVVTTGS
jgi:hypothetical protein